MAAIYLFIVCIDLIIIDKLQSELEELKNSSHVNYACEELLYEIKSSENPTIKKKLIYDPAEDAFGLRYGERQKGNYEYCFVDNTCPY